MVGVAQTPGPARQGRRLAASTVDGKPVGSRAHRPVVHRRRRQPAAAVLPVPAVGGRRRLRPDRRPRPATSARRASSTPCPTRPTRDDGTQSLLTQVCARSWRSASWRASTAAGRTAPPTASARCSRVFHRDGLTGPVTRVVSVNQACPATPFVATYEGVHGGVRARPARTTPRGVRHPDPRRRAGRRRRCRPTRSPPAAAASTRTSAPPTPSCRRPGSPGSAASTAAAGAHTDRGAHHRPGPRVPRRAGGQRAGAEPGPGPAVPVQQADTGASRGGGDAMARGQLRVYLGAAPGVGKTYTMLEEAHRRADRGTDVVVGFVETHGRQHTAGHGRRPGGRAPQDHRPTAAPTFTEMDLDAVLARRPEVALVDELAHTNVPGSPQRQALAGHRGAARRRHHRAHHRQHPAPGVAQRRRRADHRRRAARDRARRGRPRAPSRSSWST